MHEKLKAKLTQVSLKNVLKVKESTCKFFSALFLLLVGSGPIEKLGSSSLVSSIFQKEEKLH